MPYLTMKEDGNCGLAMSTEVTEKYFSEQLCRLNTIKKLIKNKEVKMTTFTY